MLSFKDEFIEKLNTKFPEKVVYLFGLEYTNRELKEYILDNILTPLTFDANQFKSYLEEKRYHEHNRSWF